MNIQTYTTSIKPIPQNRKLAKGNGSRFYINKPFQDTWNAIQRQFSMIKVGHNYPTLCTDVSVEIETGYDRMDIDGIIKPCLDYLQGIAYKNDKQINELSIKRVSEKHLKIIVKEITA